jgi:hypothetical protein
VLRRLMPPPPKKKPETFIGNDSSTMMTEETFEEFEARMKAESEGDEAEDDDAADTGDESDDGEAWGTKLGPGGRPVDLFGEEWDYVSHEGMGFNDEDDEDALDFEKDGKNYFKPDWGPLRPGDYVGYWSTNFALEEAQSADDEGLYQAALEEKGFRNQNHWKRVQTTFLRHYHEDPEFTNAAMEARQIQTRAAMKQAVKPGLLEPIEGVSLQLYASIAAQQMSVQGPAFVKLLAKHKLDEAKFARVSEAWLARMSDQSDPMAAAAIATEYGKAFSGAGTGQFGQSAREASESLGINDKVAGKNARGASGNMTFERYVEVMTAQSCWATQGKDVNVMLKKVFGMNAIDWSNASAHWSQRMSTDVKLMMEEFPKYQAKYTEKYNAGVEDPDADLDV